MRARARGADPCCAPRASEDKNPGKEEETAKQTSRLNNAYEILMNPTERRDFEERFFGAASFRPPPATGGPVPNVPVLCAV